MDNYYATQPSLVERLPPELRRYILSFLNLDDLTSFVHASPVFHQQYRASRQYILYSSLTNTLGNLIVEAIAVSQSESADFAARRTRQVITDHVHQYQDLRLKKGPTLMIGLEIVDVVGMAKFYHNIIRPLVLQYACWARENLSGIIGKPLTHEAIKLSDTEDTRVLRGLYRFQLFSQLFGCGSHSNTWTTEFGDEDFIVSIMLHSFFSKFEPWEVEEFSCVHTFAKNTYNEIFNKIHDHLQPNDLAFINRYSQRSPNDYIRNSFGITNRGSRELFLDGTASRGLEVLYHARTCKDQDLLIRMMRESVSFPVGYRNLAVFFGKTTQSRRAQRFPSDKDRRSAAREPLPFQGDAETLPPMSWTILWRQTYSKLYGCYLPESIRRWGHIMWDEKRLIDSGVYKILKEQWMVAWRNNDPRNWAT